MLVTISKIIKKFMLMYSNVKYQMSNVFISNGHYNSLAYPELLCDNIPQLI